MSTDAVPLELVVRIVDLAFDGTNTSTLKSCALVSSMWRAASRPKIFEEVKISSDARLGELEDLLDHDDGVGQFIRTLTVRPHKETIPTPLPWLATIGTRLSPRLTELRTVRFADVFDFGDSFTEEFVHTFSSFASVERLAFEECTINLAVPYCVAASLPCLRSLDLGFIMPLQLLADLPQQLHPPSLAAARLDIGHIYPYGFSRAAEWLLSTPSRDTTHRPPRPLPPTSPADLPPPPTAPPTPWHPPMVPARVNTPRPTRMARRLMPATCCTGWAPRAHAAV